MIEVTHSIANCDKLATWLEQTIRPTLRPDVSNYAKGRLRAWLRTEPPLSQYRSEAPGVPVADKIWQRLAELIEWQFDYCLVTYSGDEKAIGISPHRDAAFANYIARGLHVTGECRFNFWNERQAVPASAARTTLDLQPGQVIEFNCKHLHAAEPGTQRWNLNFWRKK